MKELVWSGISLFPDKKVFDFRPVMINGEYHLAAISPQDAEWVSSKGRKAHLHLRLHVATKWFWTFANTHVLLNAAPFC